VDRAWVLVGLLGAVGGACGGGEPVSQAECMEIAAMFSDAVAEEHEAHAVCSSDADCTLVAIEVTCGESGLLTTCPMAVAGTAAEDFRAAGDRIGAAHCAEGCRSLASCDVGVTRCEAGRCVHGPAM